MSEQAEQQSMLFQVDSPVSPFLWPVSKKEKKTTDIYGPKCFASSENLNRITSSVRMYLESSTSRLTRFVPIWSVKATKSGYLILKLRLSALRTEGTGSPLLLTPNVMDSMDAREPEALMKQYQKNRPGRTTLSTLREQVVYGGMWPTPQSNDAKNPGGHQAQNDLSKVVLMYPTPTRRDYKGAVKPETLAAKGRTETNSLPDSIMAKDGGQLNPTWVEWLMGYPENYTEVD